MVQVQDYYVTCHRPGYYATGYFGRENVFLESILPRALSLTKLNLVARETNEVRLGLPASAYGTDKVINIELLHA
jgi:hypothetical protein